MKHHPPVFRNTYEGDALDFQCTKCGADVHADVHQPPTMRQDYAMWFLLAVFMLAMIALAFS